MKVYVDYLFVENVVISYCILKETSYFLPKKTNKKRYIVASTFSSLYTILIFVITGETEHFLLGKLFIIIATLYIAFKPVKIKEYIKIFGVFYIVASINVGITSMIAPSMLNILPIRFPNIMIIYFVCLIISNILSKKMWKIYKLKIRQRDLIKEVTLIIDNKKYSYKAFVDTGNTVYSHSLNCPISFAKANIEINESVLSKYQQTPVHINTILCASELIAYFLPATSDNNNFIMGTVFTDDKLSINGEYDMVLNYSTYIEEMGGINI